MINFFKGLLCGIGNIIPGVSGSALLIIMDIYEKCITSITELLKLRNIKKNIIFLIPIAIGIVIGTVLFGNFIKFFLNKYPMPTTYIFFGLILGTIPFLFRKASKEKFSIKNIPILLFTMGLGIVLMLFGSNVNQPQNIGDIQKIICGFVLASSTIIPGISSTVLLSLIGVYDVYLEAIIVLDVAFLIPVIIGFSIGLTIFSLLINYLLKKFYSYTYYGIIGFLMTTMPTVIKGEISNNFISLISILLLILSFLITYYLSGKE